MEWWLTAWRVASNSEQSPCGSVQAVGQPQRLPSTCINCEQAVRQTLKHWQEARLGGLWEGSSRGGKTKWQSADIEAVESWLQERPSYTSVQLGERLDKEQGVAYS